MKKVFVSGCFDMLHSGHIVFLERASKLGKVYVGIGSDKTIQKLKNRKPINSEQERLFMIKSLKFVKDAFINSGEGLLDFAADVETLKPDIFYVNWDGNTEDKRKFCLERGIAYIIDERDNDNQFELRSTTSRIKSSQIPYRLDLAGGWIDQDFVNWLYPGSVITCSIEPTQEFNEYSGLASSTRKRAISLWGERLPDEPSRLELAQQLFIKDNELTLKQKYISGSQDSLGICLPGVNQLYYDSGFWPKEINSDTSEETLQWLESILWLVPLWPREPGLDLYANRNLTVNYIKGLAESSKYVWKAIQNRNYDAFITAFQNSFECQISLFPNMVTDKIWKVIQDYSAYADAYKLTGAGGGGYLIVVSKKPVPNGISIKICR